MRLHCHVVLGMHQEEVYIYIYTRIFGRASRGLDSSWGGFAPPKPPLLTFGLNLALRLELDFQAMSGALHVNVLLFLC